MDDNESKFLRSLSSCWRLSLEVMQL